MPQRPPEAFVYYLDANLDGPELVNRLRAGGMPCEPHRDHFASDARDEAWIPAIASRGNATVIMIRGEKLSAEDMSKLLLTAHGHRRLDNYIAKRTPPM